MASFSGRVPELTSFMDQQSFYQRSTVILPRRHGVVRIVQKQRTLQCNAIALRDVIEYPWVKQLLGRLNIIKVQQAPPAYIDADTETAISTRWKVGSAIKDATLTAVSMGLSLTGAAFHLASRVVSEWQQKAHAAQESKAVDQQSADARQKVQIVQTQLEYEIQRERLELQGKDQAFVSMLHALDRCHLDHDVKWALVQKHTADKAEFSERLQQLYSLAEASKAAVDTLLHPEASRKQINTFWKSPETVAIIAEEDKLKSLVFAQMLQATAQ